MTIRKVICLGEAMVELSLNDATPDQARISYAGDTFNTAIYLKRSAPELEVGYATQIGSDRLSDGLLQRMRDEGLDTALTRRSRTQMPGLYAISTDDAGERSFMYWRSASAARQMFAASGLSFGALATADLLYLSAISLAILPEAHRNKLLAWLPVYRAGGGLVAFDSNYRPALWSSVEVARAAVETAWRNSDLGLPSVDDEMALFGDTNDTEVLARLHGWGVVQGALKRGAEGPLALSGKAAGPFAPAARVVDSTAAGDSFNAAYLAARLRGAAEPDCLMAGHQLASRVIGARGAILPRDGANGP